MRITRENVEAARDIANQMTEFIDDLDSNAETWLDEEVDADERTDARDIIEQSIENLNDLGRQFIELGDKWAFYETATTKKLKARIAELEEKVSK